MSQIGTVEAVGYIKVRSPTEGHQQTPNQAPRVTSQLATGTYLRPCTVQCKSQVNVLAEILVLS